MATKNSILVLILLMCSLVAGARQRVGLVLSGGGAKGVAHIGVIKALEEHDVAIDYVAGTSMGAIVGGLYAAGYTPEEMMELIESPDFQNWAAGVIDPKYSMYYYESDRMTGMATLNFGELKGSDRFKAQLPTSFINPMPMSFAFMELFAPYTAQCDGNFDRLFVPLRTVTSDIYAKHKVVCRRGSLGDAIRASMSFPLVFKPIELDGVLMYDGGIYDNFPVDVMHDDFKPDVMIGVDVSNPDKKPERGNVAQQLEDMVIQNNDYSLPESYGVKVKVDVSMFSLLDFGKAREIYERGYERGMEMMDSILARVDARESAEHLEARRAAFKAATPLLVFDSVRAEGGSASQNAYFEHLFSHDRPDTFGIARAKQDFYTAVSTGKITELMPTASRGTADSLFTLNLRGSMKNRLSASGGAFVSTSTSSMFYLGASYSTVSVNAIDAHVQAWAGQSYLAAMVDGSMALRTPFPSSIALEGVVSHRKFHQTEKLFFEDDAPTFVIHNELFARASWRMAAGRRGKIEAGAAYGRLTNRYHPNAIEDMTTDDRDKTIRDLATLFVRYRRSTLNNATFPTSGFYIDAEATGVAGTNKYIPATALRCAPDKHHDLYGRLHLHCREYFGVAGPVSLGLESEVRLSTRKLPEAYSAAIVEAPAFCPTPSSYNAFNPAFRANSFVTAGIVPVWRVGQLFQIRAQGHIFLPVRPIVETDNHMSAYDGWFKHPEFFGEAAAVVTLPFGEVKGYANYLSSPSANWNFGISLGLFVLAPKLLR